MSEKKPLTQKYIEEHSLTIHDYDSWGKAIAEQILNEAQKKASDKNNSVTFDVPVKVESNTKGCITICAWGVCIHVKT